MAGPLVSLPATQANDFGGGVAQESQGNQPATEPAAAPLSNDPPREGTVAHELNQVKDVEKQLTCPLCLDLFANAQALYPCGHVLCGECLNSLLKTANASCLECTRPIDLAHRSVPAKVLDFAVDRFLEERGDEEEIRDMRRRRAGWKQVTPVGDQTSFNAAVQQKVEYELIERVRQARTMDIRKINQLVAQHSASQLSLQTTQLSLDAEKAAHRRTQDQLSRASVGQNQLIRSLFEVSQEKEKIEHQATQAEKHKERLALALSHVRMGKQVEREGESMREVGYVPGVSKMGVISLGSDVPFCLGGYLMQVSGSSSGKIPQACIPTRVFDPQGTACQGGPSCESLRHAKVFDIPTHLVSVIYGPQPRFVPPNTAYELCPSAIVAKAMDALRDVDKQHEYVSYPPNRKPELRIAFARRHVVWPVPVPTSPAVLVQDSLWLPWCHRLYPEHERSLPAIPADADILTKGKPEQVAGRLKSTERCIPNRRSLS